RRAVHGPLQLLPRRRQALLHPLRHAQRADHPVRHLQPVLSRREHRRDSRTAGRRGIGGLGVSPLPPPSGPAPPAKRRNPWLALLMILTGAVLLLPGLCAVVMTIGMSLSGVMTPS